MDTRGSEVRGRVALAVRPAPADETAISPADAPGRDESAEFLELVHSLLHAVRRDATTRLEPVGTTPGQLRLLRALQHADGPRRLGELAQVLDVAPRSITAKVDQAEADGQVRRFPDPDDRRATLVELTVDGLAILARVSAERSVGAGERLARLAPDERAELLRLLRVVAAPPA
ncbi:MAG TPA: MarR family transcriptional regulator [Cellulomonas sp.]